MDIPDCMKYFIFSNFSQQPIIIYPPKKFFPLGHKMARGWG
jgi:hypothetical protein